MKKIFRIFSVLLLTSLLLSGCDEFNELTAPTVNTGSANFTRFVSIGNSLTMGEQSQSVFVTGQKYSFGKIIADIVGTTYEQATFSDPGTGDRIEVQSLEPFETVINPDAGSPTNLTYPAPYNNLGVKGAFLTDVLNARDANSAYTAQFGSPNPLFDAVLRGLGTQLELAMAQQPTFVTLWIGHNDVLAFATRGGLFPITDPAQFAADFATILNSLQAVGAQIVIGNITDVKNIPFFKTVGPGIGLKLQENGLPGLVYAKTTGETGVALVNDLFANNVLVLLTGSDAANFIGDQTGAYYLVNGIPVPPGVDINFPFGLAPENPWPNNLILDPDEMAIVDQTVAAYNDIIEGEASSRGLAIVDVHQLLNDIDSPGGVVANGIRFTSEFVNGNAYSLDGVHPTSQGYGLVANEFIRTINNKFGASIPLVDVATIPGSLVFGPFVKLGEHGIPNIPHGALDHVLF